MAIPVINFTATPRRGGVIDLAWSQVVPALTKVVIIRNQSSDPSVAVDDFKINVDEGAVIHKDLGLKPRTLYTYRIYSNDTEFVEQAAATTF